MSAAPDIEPAAPEAKATSQDTPVEVRAREPVADPTPAFASRRERRNARLREGGGAPTAPAVVTETPPIEAAASGRTEPAASKATAEPPAAPPEPLPERPAPRLVALPGASDTGAPSLGAPPRGTGSGPRLATDAGPQLGPPPLRAVSGAAPSARRGPVIELGRRGGSAAIAEARDLSLPPEPDLPPPEPAPRPGTFGTVAPDPPRRSPVVVVAMTLTLLALLAIFAIWSTFWPSGSATDSDSNFAGTVDPDGAANPFDANLPSTEDEAAFDGEPDLGAADPTDMAALPEDEAGDPMPDPEPVTEAAVPVLPTDPAAAALDTAAAAPDLPVDVAADPDPSGVAPADAALPDAAAASTEVALVAPAIEPDPEAGSVAADPEAEADGEPEPLAEAVPDTPALPQDPVTELVPTDAGAAERVREQLLAELTPEVADRRYAATGIWVLPPGALPEPGQDNTDDLYVAAIDDQIAAEDAVALAALTPDPGLLSPLPPPPAGTPFDLDERGLVRPTPEGALNPDGIQIFAGRPPVAPAPRPGSVVPDAVAPRAGATDGADAATPTIRPRPRPSDLSETNEKAQLGGRTKAQLAGLRPRFRPATMTITTEAATDEAVTPAVVVMLAPATANAVARSLQPKRRPAEIVAVAAATRVAPIRPAPDEPAPDTAKPDDHAVAEADNEPMVEVASVAAVAPKIPSKASVVQNATVKNAINLSKINLIGVYGSPSQRRALVRLSNGKYVKVKIGDRLDGGKVAAIGDAELIYTKSGRQVKLALPKT